MMSFFLDAVDVASREDLSRAYPHLVKVYDAIQELSEDPNDDEGIPFLLQALEAEKREFTTRSWILRICHAVRSIAFLYSDRVDLDSGKLELLFRYTALTMPPHWSRVAVVDEWRAKALA